MQDAGREGVVHTKSWMLAESDRAGNISSAATKRFAGEVRIQ